MHPEDPLASTGINCLRGFGKHEHESVLFKKCIIFCHPKNWMWQKYRAALKQKHSHSENLFHQDPVPQQRLKPLQNMK